MAKKQEPKVVEFKTTQLSSGETVLVTVYESVPDTTKRTIKCRGKQTSDFNLVGGWQRDPYKKSKEPTC